MSRYQRLAHTVTLAAALTAATPGVAAAGINFGALNRATVVSVDGPRDFTIRREHRLYKIRLGEINTPRGATPTRKAECGAPLGTAALRRMAPRGKRVDVLVSGRRESGRFLGDALPAGRSASDTSPFTDRLVQLGLSREGLPQSIDAQVIPNANTLELEYIAMNASAGTPYSDVDRARAHLGVWGACNGRFHLPGGTAPPAVRPARWQISADGQTAAVGSLTLPTTVPPAPVLTFAAVAHAFPDLEIVRSYDGLCVGTSARGALWFQGAQGDQTVGNKHRDPCAIQHVRGIASLDANPTASGLAVGGPESGLAAFPQRTSLDNPRYVELDGSNASDLAKHQGCDASPEGRWRTAATLQHGRIAGWFTRLPEPC